MPFRDGQQPRALPSLRAAASRYATERSQVTMFPKIVPVRLTGKDRSALRIAAYLRERGCCKKCGGRTYLDADEASPVKADMAHIKSLGAGGSDELSNVENWCHRCHMRKHNGEKPCPPKPALEVSR